MNYQFFLISFMPVLFFEQIVRKKSMTPKTDVSRTLDLPQQRDHWLQMSVSYVCLRVAPLTRV